MTQEDLAEKVDRSQRWVSNLETGGVRQSRIRTLRALSDALDLPLVDLVLAAGYAGSRADAETVAESNADVAPGPAELPAHLRTSFLKVKDLSPQSQKIIEDMIDRLAELDVREFQDPKRGPDTEWPEDFDPDDKTPIKLPFPQ